MDFLFFLGQLFLNPFTVQIARARITSILVSFLPSSPNNKESKKFSEKARLGQFMKKFGENAED